ncbi:MAG: antitoxin family protein [Stenomitos rutilans HA7619-LM2]|nr:antitoxin family protein [Stenomitos rutilans HA7619-LM2]
MKSKHPDRTIASSVGRDRYTGVIVYQTKRMTESQTIEAVYENGILRPVHPVTGLVEHSKVRLAIEYEAQAVHPLAKFAGILSNEEAEEVQTILAEEFGKVDVSGW